MPFAPKKGMATATLPNLFRGHRWGLLTLASEEKNADSGDEVAGHVTRHSVRHHVLMLSSACDELSELRKFIHSYTEITCDALMWNLGWGAIG